ncbi:MAG: hypothetical protein OSB47_14830, partial [Pirellulaceae bacterium]|nr:hypothetical protein [Pirellulaceae bacterium]
MVLFTLPSSRWITLLFTAVLAGIQLPAVAQQTSTDKGGKAAKKAPTAFVKPQKTRFIQVKRTKGGEPEALQTAIVRYVPETGDNELIVDLIGAVHIGDRLYYQKLNKLFENYDVVLYELVAPEGTVIPKGGRTESTNPLAMIQTMMKSVLGLELQLEKIDYTKNNFVHADLSPEKMAEAMKKRGDDGLTLALGIAADFIRSQNVQSQKQATASKPSLPEIDPLSLL